ncbi:MAG: hypothetical protein LC790_04915, partial [Actinobacteria bacterium]|nr:hypothetical protein [Actinomycetota bacterium]MCA1698267.1 hypothetical protein [Actinomycetota bacterium]
LLEQRDDLDGAKEAWRRADARGHPDAGATLEDLMSPEEAFDAQLGRRLTAQVKRRGNIATAAVFAVGLAVLTVRGAPPEAFAFAALLALPMNFLLTAIVLPVTVLIGTRDSTPADPQPQS